MRLQSMAFVVCALTALGTQAPNRPAQGGSQTDRTADMAAIEKLRKQDIDATIARDPAALTDLWADDAIRIGVGAPPEVGKETIRKSNERATANKAFKVLSYVPELKDFTFLDGGYAVEWRTYTGSFITAPGGEATEVRGTVLAVYKRLPDGRWRTFRALGSVEPVTKAGGL